MSKFIMSEKCCRVQSKTSWTVVEVEWEQRSVEVKEYGGQAVGQTIYVRVENSPDYSWTCIKKSILWTFGLSFTKTFCLPLLIFFLKTQSHLVLVPLPLPPGCNYRCTQVQAPFRHGLSPAFNVGCPGLSLPSSWDCRCTLLRPAFR